MTMNNMLDKLTSFFSVKFGLSQILDIVREQIKDPELMEYEIIVHKNLDVVIFKVKGDQYKAPETTFLKNTVFSMAKNKVKKGIELDGVSVFYNKEKDFAKATCYYKENEEKKFIEITL